MKNMKMLKFLVIAVIFLLIGYALGNLFPYSVSDLIQKGIEGNAELQVAILTEDGNPVSNLEVDVAKQPGPPPPGGVAITNEQGIAVFNIHPGDYVIYFNASNFPENLQTPDSEQITVEENTANQHTIILKTK